jgi:hypothetical protein
MSTLSATIDLHVPAEQLFTHLALAWESGTALGNPQPGAAPDACARMAVGLRLPCTGEDWALPADVELEVRDLVEPAGWQAVSRPDPAFSWTVRIAPLGQGARLTCVLRYRPHGVRGRLAERLGGRRRRRRALRRLLGAWQADAERQDALGRLRAALEGRGSAHPRDGS